MEIVRGAYEAFNRNDTEALLAFLAEDVELEERFLSTEAGFYRGHDGVRRWIAGAYEAMDSPAFEVLRYSHNDDVVVSVVSVRARGASSGAEVTARLSHAIRLRDGKVVYIGAFGTVEEALDAVGLAE